MKVEPARRIGRLPKAQQAGEAKKVIEAAKAPRQRRKPAVEHTGEASTVNAVHTSEGGAPAGSPAPSTVNAVNTQRAQAPESAAQPEAEQPDQLPYGDALSVVTQLHLKMTPEVFAEGARVWLRILREEHPDAYVTLLQELDQQAQQLA